MIFQYRAGFLDSGDYGAFAVESLSETKSKISLDCVSEQDAGLYECVAHSAGGRKTSVGTEVHVVSKYICSILNVYYNCKTDVKICIAPY